MRRKSCCSVWRATSAMAPAISTPVGAAADDHEGEQPALLGLVLGQLGALEREQEAPADVGRVLDPFQAGRERRPFVMTEIGMRRAGREDQIVVGDADRIGVDARASASTPVTRAISTRAFCCRRSIERIGQATSAGESAAVAT